MTDRVAVAAERGLVFSEPPGYRPLELDLYRPAGPPAPLVVYLHGGGWQRGSRRHGSPATAEWDPSVLVRVAQAGFAVASVDYRLSGEATFPAQLDDVRSATRWFRTEAGSLGFDGTRVALWGDSAGGHLALLHGLDRPSASDPQVAAMVGWYPATDLVGLEADTVAVGGESHLGADSREGRLLGGSLDDLVEQARRASPLTYVRRGAPPCLLVHGTNDLSIPAAQSTRLAEALVGAGNDATVELIDGCDHLWKGASGSTLDRILGITTDFLRTRLGVVDA